jgi:hypothetical protein
LFPYQQNGKQETTLFPNDEVCMILDYAKLLKDSGLADQVCFRNEFFATDVNIIIHFISGI